MTRLIEDVHEKIYKLIPLEQVELRRELDTFIQTLWNIAPEVRSGPEAYIPYASILSKWINPNAENLVLWQNRVIAIFTGSSEEFKEDMSDFDYMHHTMGHY